MHMSCTFLAIPVGFQCSERGSELLDCEALFLVKKFYFKFIYGIPKKKI